MQAIENNPLRNPHNHPSFRTPHSAFTLVELLVVIAIIGLLVALILPAVMGGQNAARRAAILTEISQFDAALKDYKNNLGSFPPNAQSNDAGNRIDDAKILSDFKRHLKKAFPSHREPPALINALVGQGTSPAPNLEGGMNGAEAVVFWLGGFSDDPKYPISGIGGPSYVCPNGFGDASNNELDPIDNRNWRLDVKIDNLGPRTDDGYFNGTDGRFIEYTDPQDSTGSTVRRLNFWYLKAPSSLAPYVYFDASRASTAQSSNDVPAMSKFGSSVSFSGPDSDALNQLFYVHAIKTRKSNTSNVAGFKPYQYANDGTFQILHPGLDDEWGVMPVVTPSEPSDTEDPLWLIDSEELVENDDDQVALQNYYPDGPWGIEARDTLTNFADGTLEDAQP